MYRTSMNSKVFIETVQFIHIVYASAVEQDESCGGLLEGSHDVQQGRLSHPGCTGYGERVTAAEAQIDAFQNLYLMTVMNK